MFPLKWSIEDCWPPPAWMIKEMYVENKSDHYRKLFEYEHGKHELLNCLFCILFYVFKRFQRIMYTNC